MKRVLLIMVLVTSIFSAIAQVNPWKQVNLTAASKGKDVFQKHFKPSAYVSFQLDETGMWQQLKKAPSERNVSFSRSSAIISVPDSKGRIERFRIVESPSMQDGLSAKHPDIRSYSGVSIDHPGSSIRFSMSQLGFHAKIISADRKAFYVSCVDKANKSYIIYDREVLNDKKYDFDCLLDEAINTNTQGSVTGKGGLTGKDANTNTLRVYRTALNLTGEFSRAVLADVAPGTDTSTDALKKAIVLALANELTTEANSYFENEMNLRLVLINNETDIIYLNPATDPFSTWTTTFTTTTWNTETQNNCTNVIGNANYDVGHMLTYNTEKNNGNAGCIGCICKTPSGSIGKGRGWNMYGEYQGYYLVVDYWTHELGHQFGGNHTFTHSIEGSLVQVEPGSGTTIMAYAGITGATDVSSHSDPFFHSKSIEQITDYIQTGTGNTCGTTITLTNNIPTANAGSDYTVPKSTPFLLTGTSTDADAGDVRTYSWEQIDNYATGANTYPTATSTKGPMFRYFPPVASTSRSFPRMEVVLDSQNTGKWEVLPSVARTMNFRFMVRDNHSPISANKSDDMVVTVGTAGPFLVTSPNTGVSYASGSTQTITWSVNSTNVSPYATNVKITLSTDGGNTFPYTLASSTANDGTESVTLPNVQSGACRIKVEAVGNIFFDVSNVNFAIGACGTAVGLKAASVTASAATISWTAVTGATSYDVDYRIVGATSWTNAATATTATSVNLTGLVQGTDYEFRVKTNCTFNNGAYATETFSTLCSVAPASIAASNITNSTATLSWPAAAGAASYKVDYKLSTETIWVRAENETTALTTDIANLVAGKTYNIRVRSNCASSLAYSSYVTSTFNTACAVAPSGLASSGVTNAAATLSWSASAGATSYTVDYKLASSGTWVNAVTNTTATSLSLSSLTQGSLYDYRVRGNCSSGNTAYTTSQFTTACSVAPSSLSASSITNVSATLSWTAASGAVSYDVDYKSSSAGSWISLATATTAISVNVSSLTQGTVYDYRVRTNCATGSSSYAIAQFTTLCSVAPSGLSATSITNASATISWSAVAGAINYSVDYKLSSASTWTTFASATTATTASLTGLTQGAVYDYRVRTNCASGSTAYTSAQFTTLCTVAPSGLSASAVTNNSATVSWTSVNGAASYDVDYKLSGAGTWTNAATATTALSVNLSALTQGAVYDYRVRTNCASGSTVYTTAQFTTLCTAAPTGLSSSAVTNNSATISWTSVNGASSYDVDYKFSGAGTWTNAATATTALSVNLSGLTQGAVYDYRVRTNCASGNTTYTSAQFTTLCTVTPTGLSTSTVSDNSATVTWAAVSGASSYDVDYKISAESIWINAATATTATSIDLSGLSTGVQYDYRVRANCASGSTAYSSALFTTTCSAAPAGLNASAVTTSSATLSWSAASGAASYDVDYKLSSLGSWINIATATTTTSVNISGLDYNSVYDWRVRTNCAVGSSSYAVAQFTTQTPVCNDASGLTSSGVTASAATISWSSVSGAASYDVEYKASTASTWTSAATATTLTTVNLSGLTASTTYDWRVRVNCVYGNTSNYVAAQFNTLLAPGCSIPVTVLTSNITSSSATLSWSAVNNAIGYTVGYRSTNTLNWTNLATGTTALSINVTGLASESNYEWRVKAVCASGSSAYNSTSFVTLTSCPGKYDTVLHNSFTTAISIPLNTDIVGRINDVVNVDYYKVTISKGGPVTITLYDLPLDYNLYSYNNNLKITGNSSNTGTTSENINVTLAKGNHYIKVINASNDLSGAECYTLRVTEGSAAKNNLSSLGIVTNEISMKLYPNPAHSLINVSTGKVPEHTVIKITDVYGRAVMQVKAGLINTQLDVSKLKPGSYFVTVLTKEGTVMHNTKFVKY